MSALLLSLSLTLVVHTADADPSLMSSVTASTSLLGSSVSSLYTCSMHPHVRSEHSTDRCPICGMALIPIVQDDVSSSATGRSDTGDAVLPLSPRAYSLLQPELTPVRRQPVEFELSLVGRLAIDQRQLKTVSAWASGRIEELFVNSTDIDVTLGQPIASIFSPDVIVIQRELLQAKQLLALAHKNASPSAVQSARAMFDSAQQRLRLLSMPNSQIDAILRTDAVLDTVTIRAPASGRVIEKWVNSGAYISLGQPLFTLVNLESLWLELEVFEHQVSLIEPGQRLVVELLARAGEVFHAEVLLLESVVDANRRTVRARAVLDNTEGRLKPGMLARARLHGSKNDALLIPVSAALQTGERALVYVKLDEEQPTFVGREVTLGRRFGDQYEVLAGLSEHELVVSKGAFRLDSELQIRGLPSMMAPEGGASDPHAHHGHAATRHTPDAEPQRAVATPPSSTLHHFQLADADEAIVLAAYQRLYQALINDDLAGWQQGTTAFHQAVAAIDWPEHLQPLVAEMQHGAGHSHHVGSIERAREQYYRHVQALLVLTEQGVLAHGWYRAYCPMARGDQGATWLQPQSNVLNPYYGAMMLRCGEVEQQYPAGGEHAH